MSEAAASFRICGKCFAEVPISAPFCTDCGAPISDEPGAEGSDAVVYPELTRANLLRMRGEYDQARSICLAILRRFPNNATAHTLLGDICNEEDDLRHAAEWYEMALDLEPENTVDRKKLDTVRQRMSDHEAASTAQQLGIPTTKPKAKLFAAVVVCVVVLIGVGAFFLGDYLRSKKAGGGTVTTPVQIGEEDKGASNAPPISQEPVSTVPEPEAKKPNDAPAAPLISAASSIDDQKDLERVRSECVHGASIVEAKFDPRSAPASLTVTFNLSSAEDTHGASAEVASSAIEKLGVGRVTVRAVRDGKVVFIADMDAADLASVQPNSDGKKTPEALANAFKNVWDRQSVTEPTR